MTNAIKSMKSGKTSGIDGIPTELLKADINTAAVTLYIRGLIWEENKTPKTGLKGLLSSYLYIKKGDLGNCDNRRGTTLLQSQVKCFAEYC